MDWGINIELCFRPNNSCQMSEPDRSHIYVCSRKCLNNITVECYSKHSQVNHHVGPVGMIEKQMLLARTRHKTHIDEILASSNTPDIILDTRTTQEFWRKNVARISWTAFRENQLVSTKLFSSIRSTMYTMCTTHLGGEKPVFPTANHIRKNSI